MAGIVGHERYQFNVWGDTVNVVARLTGVASPSAVTLTNEVGARLSGDAVHLRGAVELKGEMQCTDGGSHGLDSESTYRRRSGARHPVRVIKASFVVRLGPCSPKTWHLRWLN
jgi:hypothetical protein